MVVQIASKELQTVQCHEPVLPSDHRGANFTTKSAHYHKTSIFFVTLDLRQGKGKRRCLSSDHSSKFFAHQKAKHSRSASSGPKQQIHTRERQYEHRKLIGWCGADPTIRIMAQETLQKYGGY